MSHTRKFILPDVSHKKRVKGWVEDVPIEGYQHASDEAIEDFLDLKFGVRIHFGLYSIWELRSESWPYLKMPPQRKQEYQDLYTKFNPMSFDAQGWMEFFKRSGLKIFAITTKHHEGFSLYDTKTKVKNRIQWDAPDGPKVVQFDKSYSVMDTPFKRDIIKELCAAAHQEGIKIDLYFSHPDWHDADFRPYADHPINTPECVENPKEFYGSMGKGDPTYLIPRTDAERDRMVLRHRTQLKEILSNYGKIDLVCLDQWLGADIWPETRKTMLELRKIQPDVMFRARGIGNYGDYHTPEGYVPGDPSNTDMPWMVIYPLGRSFSYEKEASKHKGVKWVIHNLIDTAAKGGGVFMVGIGPNGEGKFHPEAIKQLETVGKWLEINGEGIYATRPYNVWKQGKHIRFTRSKDRKTVYVHLLKWPKKQVKIKCIESSKVELITMLGVQLPLEWDGDSGKIVVNIPSSLKNTLPYEEAWVLKITFKLRYK
jgi:alpha-L-fucosidase